MLIVKTTERFDRMLVGFLKYHKDLRLKTIELMKILAKNPKDSKAKPHSLSGNFKGYHSASINFKYRIMFFYDDKSIYFISVGGHDDVY